MLQPALADIRGNLTRLESKVDIMSDQVEEHGDMTDLDLVLNNSLMKAWMMNY